MNRLVILVSVVALGLVAGGCNIPMPFGASAHAGPEAPGPPPPAAIVTTPQTTATAAVAAWQSHNQVRLGELANATARDALMTRPFPSPAPQFVDCKGDRWVAGGTACFFWSSRRLVTLVTQHRVGSESWEVTEVRVFP